LFLSNKFIVVQNSAFINDFIIIIVLFCDVCFL
jgi:hypothetical protein